MIAAYITFNGNTEEAFNFYSWALEGKITNLQRFGDSPNGGQMSDADKKKVMHIALEAPHGVTLMGNDHVDFMGESFIPGNNFSLFPLRLFRILIFCLYHLKDREYGCQAHLHNPIQ